MRVLKFGGTSMVDAKSWRRVLNIINHSKHPVVVVSATDRTTRHLANAARTAVTNLDNALIISEEIAARHREIVSNFLTENGSDKNDEIRQNCLGWIQKCSANLSDLLKEINDDQKVSPKKNDAVLSLGEQLSARLFALCGNAYGLKTIWIDARKVIKTDNTFGSARPDLNKIEVNISHVEEKASQNIIPVIGGFYGENEAGQITTLGFEGSDYSASLIGAALNAETIEIWTDVSGVFTCDPRFIQAAQPIEMLSFNDAEQLANHGAKVLHPSSVQPAASKNIPVLVKNIFQPQHSGTTINTTAAETDSCKALAFIKNITAYKINTANMSIREHRLVEVFAILDEYEASTVAIKTDKESAFIVLNDADQAKQLKKKLTEITAVREINNQGLIGLIGCKKAENQAFIKWVANVLQQKPALLIPNKQKEVLNVLVNGDELLETVRLLHNTIFE